MIIFVTIRALREIQAVKSLAWLVTFLAGHGNVFPQQGESGFSMAEFGLVNSMPPRGRMAFSAIPVESGLMINLMTAEAF